MKYLITPLSKSMVEKLKQCRQIELQGINERPITMEDLNYALAPLYRRGLINTKKRRVGDKELLCIFVTEAGIDFLNKMEEDEKKASSENEVNTTN